MCPESFRKKPIFAPGAAPVLRPKIQFLPCWPPRGPRPRAPRRPKEVPQAMQAWYSRVGDLCSDVHGLGPAHSTSRGRPEHSKWPKCGRILGLRRPCGGSAGVMTGTQNATSGTKQTARHPRDNMGSIMHFDGLEMGSEWTSRFEGVRGRFQPSRLQSWLGVGLV